MKTGDKPLTDSKRADQGILTRANQGILREQIKMFLDSKSWYSSRANG